MRALKESSHNDGVRTTPHHRDKLGRAVGFSTVALIIAIAFYVVSLGSNRWAGRSGESPRETDHLGASALDGPALDPGALDPGDVERRTVHVRRSDGRAAGRVPQPPAAGDDSGGPATEPAEIDAGEYIAALRAAGETGGLAAFSPPGTRPPNAGIIVPDDYELPEGFMRHYQSTDEGGQLAAVLTLSPDYELFDDAGNPIPLPQDRIVPPEFAPPDLPVRILEIPSTSDRAKGRR